MLRLSDRIFLATLATLFLAVLVLEWNSRRLNMIPEHVKPALPGSVNLQQTNVPERRNGQAFVDDVAWIDSQDAAIVGNE